VAVNVSNFSIEALAVFVLWPEVSGLRDSDIGMAEDSLDDFIWQSQPVKIRRNAAPECVPSAPLRELYIAWHVLALCSCSGLLQ